MIFTQKRMSLVLLSLLTYVFFTGVAQARDRLGVFPSYSTQINPTILLEGIFYPADSHPKGNVITLFVRDKKYRFQIKDARNMTGTELGYSIISDLFPPTLRLIGNDDLLNPLLKPDVIEKDYSLLGTIYMSDNLLFLTAEKQGRLFEDDKEQKK